jgi:hypothetical protein
LFYFCLHLTGGEFIFVQLSGGIYTEYSDVVQVYWIKGEQWFSRRVKKDVSAKLFFLFTKNK